MPPDPAPPPNYPPYPPWPPYPPYPPKPPPSAPPIPVEFNDSTIGVLDGWLITQTTPTPLTTSLITDVPVSIDNLRKQARDLATQLNANLNTTAGNAFIQWSKRFRRRYRTRSESSRVLQQFVKALQRLAQQNADATYAYFEGLNQFSGTPYSEIQATVLMQGSGRRSIPPAQRRRALEESREFLSRRLAATDINWVNRGVTPPVTDQGACSSCWAHASAAALSSALSISYAGSRPQPLSLQWLLDCCNAAASGIPDVGSAGCAVGFADDAFAMSARYTMPLATAYRTYTARVGTCDTSSFAITSNRKWLQTFGTAVIKPLPDQGAGIWGFDNVRYFAPNEAALLQAVSVQPVVVLMTAADAFIGYAGGVYGDERRECPAAASRDGTSHFVLVVGFTTLTQPKYWIIQNSWGTSWGERGFGRMKMDGSASGVCGMYTQPYAPKLNNFKAVPDTI